jgi:hypothetical protein
MFTSWSGERNNYDEADGPSPGNFLCSESCPTQLNDMSGIELIYGVTSSVPKVFSPILLRENFSLQ